MTNPCDNSGLNIRINTAVLSGQLSGVAGPAGPTGCPQFTQTYVINAPAAGNYYLTYSDTSAVIKKVVAVHVGATPSVVWNIRHGSNFTGIGTPLFAADVTSTSQALGNVYPSLVAFASGADAVAASSHIWLDIASVAAGTDTFIVTLVYKPECVDVLSDKGVYVEDAASAPGFVPVVDAS